MYFLGVFIWSNKKKVVTLPKFLSGIMKKILKIAVLMVAVALATAGCKGNGPDGANAEYTVMYYGHGGANADAALLQSVRQMYEASPNAFKKVNVVAQYKFSTVDNLKAQNYTEDLATSVGGRTIRWRVNPSNSFEADLMENGNFYGELNADITHPDSLTHFINWATKTYPAKKYVLIMSDHGGGYMPHDDLPYVQPQAGAPARGVIYDDGHNDAHFTVSSFRQAIEKADSHIETVIMMACLMNNMEYVFELKDVCDYYVASTYTMPATLASLNVLVNELGARPNKIEQVLAGYCQAAVAGWDDAQQDKTKPIYNDLTVTRMAKVDALGAMLHEFTSRLCNVYANGSDEQRRIIDSCTLYSFKVQESRPSYDILQYTALLTEAMPAVYSKDFRDKLGNAYKACILAQNFSSYLTAHDFTVDYSVIFATEGAYIIPFWETVEGVKKPVKVLEYTPDGICNLYNLTQSAEDPELYDKEFVEDRGSWGSTLADTYEQLAFHQLTGWGRWLRLNKQQPTIFCFKDMNYELPTPNN